MDTARVSFMLNNWAWNKKTVQLPARANNALFPGFIKLFLAVKSIPNLCTLLPPPHEFRGIKQSGALTFHELGVPHENATTSTTSSSIGVTIVMWIREKYWPYNAYIWPPGADQELHWMCCLRFLLVKQTIKQLAYCTKRHLSVVYLTV